MKNIFAYLLFFAFAMSSAQVRVFIYNSDLGIGPSLQTKYNTKTGKDDMCLKLISHKYEMVYNDIKNSSNKNYFYTYNDNANTSDVYYNSNGNYNWVGFYNNHQPIKIDTYNPNGAGDIYGAILCGVINMFDEELSITW